MKVKWVGLREETDKSTFILGDFHVLLLVTDRTARQNTNKDTELKDTTDQQHLTAFEEPSTQQWQDTCSFSCWESHTKTDHFLGQNTNLKKIKRRETAQYVF